MIDLTLPKTPFEAMFKINEWTDLLKKANRLYYEEDQPMMTDYEYDQILCALIRLEREYPEYCHVDSPTKTVGGKVRSDFSEVKHDVAMKSLEDFFSIEEMTDFLDGIRKVVPQPNFIVEKKIDGLSVSLEYKDGIFFRGSTRGNGLVGENITENLRMIKGVLPKIKDPLPYLEVRAEVYMSYAQFERLNEEASKQPKENSFANPRNAAAGSLRQLDPVVTKERRLSIFVFNIQQIKGKTFSSHLESLNYLKELGFDVVEHTALLDTNEAVIEAINEIGKLRDTLPYGIDGAVVKVDQLADRTLLGETTKFPKWAGAFKYPPEQKKTTISAIDIQIGRTGILTPVALLKPVFVDGSLISRVTLHNENFINQKDIRVGDTVWIQKAGDVIPTVISVDLSKRKTDSKPFFMPTVCPSCHSTLVKEEVFWRCVNVNCKEQIIRRLIYFASKPAMNIEFLGERSIQTFFEQQLISSISDIYLLKEKKDQLLSLPAWQEVSVEKLLAEIEKSKQNDVYRLILGLGIRQVGEVLAKQLAKQYETLDRLQQATLEELMLLEDIGEITATEIYTFFQLDETKKLLLKLKQLGLNFSHIKEEKNIVAHSVFLDKYVVITGKFAGITRQRLKEEIEAGGGIVESSISKKTNYLINGTQKKAGLSKKQMKANELGIVSLDEETTLNYLNLNKEKQENQMKLEGL